MLEGRTWHRWWMLENLHIIPQVEDITIWLIIPLALTSVPGTYGDSLSQKSGLMVGEIEFFDLRNCLYSTQSQKTIEKFHQTFPPTNTEELLPRRRYFVLTDGTHTGFLSEIGVSDNVLTYGTSFLSVIMCSHFDKSPPYKSYLWSLPTSPSLASLSPHLQKKQRRTRGK